MNRAMFESCTSSRKKWFPLRKRSSATASDSQRGSLAPTPDLPRRASATREGNQKVRPLDFVIIGAQKSGTTSLYRYLQWHPSIYLLPEKEAPFFNLDAAYLRGWEWYCQEFFGGAPEGKLWAKATPSYMADQRVPQRLHQAMPATKLIALLRNPVDRAFSHYRMAVKRGLEKRSFAESVIDQLQPASLARDRLLPVGIEQQGYLVMGEYSRILGNYLERFSRNQLLVLFTEDLAAQPRYVIRRILRFLGIEETFEPPNLGKHYHVGGTARRVPFNAEDVSGNRWFNLFLGCFSAHQQKLLRRRFHFWFKVWNTRPDPAGGKMPPEIRRLLVCFYQDDITRLHQLLGGPVPWLDFNLPQQRQDPPFSLVADDEP
ncbi:MAG: sulfotransferase [Pedosphaera sp.]|nr:sulfotransferase [Pedosphaera sp.]